tara:strand:+ start:203 stop:364 length:162 start_codon:yes stop_codon:yes gene_type:complete
MIIKIDLKNVHKDEIQELKKYLEENCWDWKQEKKDFSSILHIQLHRGKNELER